MSRQTAFEYTVLQYCHDVITGELVNVGVLLHHPVTGVIAHKISSKYGRLRKIFPDLDSSAFKASIGAIERGLKKQQTSDDDALLAPLNSAEAIARKSLVQDDSSFQWGATGTVFGDDIHAEMDRLVRRFITWHEAEDLKKKTDSDVWKPVREKLAARSIEDRLQPAKLRSAVAEVTFEHSWKNGALHCYQPLSFDLASPENINDKVARWSGHLYHLNEAEADFKPYFIVGEPSDVSLAQTFNQAIEALKNAPTKPTIFQESELDELVDSIQDEMNAHDAKLA